MEMNTQSALKSMDLIELLNKQFKSKIHYSYTIDLSSLIDELYQLGIEFNMEEIKSEYQDDETSDNEILCDMIEHNPQFLLDELYCDYYVTSYYNSVTEELAKKFGVYCRVQPIIYDEIRIDDDTSEDVGIIYFFSEKEKNFIIEWCKNFHLEHSIEENQVIVKDWSAEQSCYFIFYGKSDTENYSVVDLDAWYNGYYSGDIEDMLPWLSYCEGDVSIIKSKRALTNSYVTSFIKNVNSTISKTEEIIF